MDANKLTVFIEQTQDDSWPIFQFPLEVDVIDANGKVSRNDLFVDSKNEELSVDIPSGFEDIIVDPRRVLLAEIDRKYKIKPTLLYDHASSVEVRHQALKSLITSFDDEMNAALVERALKDPFWSIRLSAITNGDVDQQDLINFTKNDKNAKLRAAALNKLNAESADYSMLEKYLE